MSQMYKLVLYYIKIASTKITDIVATAHICG